MITAEHDDLSTASRLFLSWWIISSHQKSPPDHASELSSVNDMANKKEIPLYRIYRYKKAAFTIIKWLFVDFWMEYKVTNTYQNSHCCQVHTIYTFVSASSNAWTWVMIWWYTCNTAALLTSVSKFCFKAAEAHTCCKNVCDAACRAELWNIHDAGRGCEALKEHTWNLCSI